MDGARLCLVSPADRLPRWMRIQHLTGQGVAESVQSGLCLPLEALTLGCAEQWAIVLNLTLAGCVA